MLNRIKNHILNLLGIDAIIPKGTAYIIFSPNGIIHKSVNGRMTIEGLYMKNVDFDPDIETGAVTIKPKTLSWPN